MRSSRMSFDTRAVSKLFPDLPRSVHKLIAVSLALEILTQQACEH